MLFPLIPIVFKIRSCMAFRWSAERKDVIYQYSRDDFDFISKMKVSDSFQETGRKLSVDLLFGLS